MTALLLCAILAIVFIVWSISKLYKATSKPDETPTTEVAPMSAEQKSANENAPATIPEKPAKTTKTTKTTKKTEPPAKPVKLISTGQDVPNLIRD